MKSKAPDNDGRWTSVDGVAERSQKEIAECAACNIIPLSGYT